MVRTVSLAIAAFLLAPAVQAETIDFEAQDGGYGFSKFSFVEDGYIINYRPISPFGFYIIDDPAGNPGMCNPGCASNGTTAFYAFNESSFTIDRENGGLFSLASLDAAGTFTGNDRPLTLTLTGTGVDGTVTTTITVDPAAAERFATFTFGQFVNLSSLTITGSTAFPEFAIDNLVVSAAAVPEPASWAMLIVGVGAMGGVLRRRPTVRFA